MLDEVILHVGMHKTGSSSIQQSFSKMEFEDVAYFRPDVPNHSGILLAIFSDRPHKRFAHARKGYDGADIRQLKLHYSEILETALRKTNVRRLLVSGESMSGARKVSAEGCQRLREFLSAHCKRIRVVAYVRSPVSYMQSAFQQRLKGGSFASWEIEKLYPNYRKRFEKLDHVFGRENVELVPYDRSLLYSGCVVRDFGRRIGVNVDERQVVSANSSLSLEATALLYVMRRFGLRGSYKGAIRDENKIVAALSTIGRQRIAFAPSVITPILEAHRDDMEWICRRLEHSIVDGSRGDSGTIASEEDLLRVAAEQKDALWDLIGARASSSGPGKGVARAVDDLYSLVARGALVTEAASSLGSNGRPLGDALTDESSSPAELLSALASALEDFGLLPAASLANAIEKAARHSPRKV